MPGCWLGDISLRLAEAGHRVTLLEPSTCLLDSVRDRAEREMPQAVRRPFFHEPARRGPGEPPGQRLRPGHLPRDHRVRGRSACAPLPSSPGSCGRAASSPWSSLNRYGEVARLLLADRDTTAAMSAFERETFPTDLNRGTGYLYSTAGVARPDGAPGLHPRESTACGSSATTWNAPTSTSLIVSPPGGPGGTVGGKEQAFLRMARFIHLIARKD